MKRTILLVTADEKSQEIIKGILEQAGHSICTAGNGTDALLHIKEKGIALIITELMLPGINGIELIREAHRSHPDIEAIVLSQYGTEATKDKLLRIGAFGYLEKPVNKKSLLDMVQSALRGSRASRILYGEAEPKLGFNRERILVVDDDPMIQEVLSRFLSEKGYRVTLAGNGRQAYEKILVNDYDCVITDVNMPELDGVQTILAIRRTDPYTYIILMSGEAESSDIKKAMENGANRFMPKPLDYDMMLSWIEEVDFARIAESKRKLSDEEIANVRRSLSWMGRVFNPYRSKRMKRTLPYAISVIIVGIILWIISALFQVRMFQTIENSTLFDKFDRMIETIEDTNSTVRKIP